MIFLSWILNIFYGKKSYRPLIKSIVRAHPVATPVVNGPKLTMKNVIFSLCSFCRWQHYISPGTIIIVFGTSNTAVTCSTKIPLSYLRFLQSTIVLVKIMNRKKFVQINGILGLSAYLKFLKCKIIKLKKYAKSISVFPYLHMKLNFTTKEL